MYGGTIIPPYCFGLEQLPHKGDVLFITGGEKDVMSLYAKGFYAISFNSETANISIDILDSLRLRFKHLVILYDVDEAGVKASKKIQKEYTKYDLLRMELPLSGQKGEKDIADYFRLGFSKKQFKTLLLKLIENIYQNKLIMIKSCEIDYSNSPAIPQQILAINNVPSAKNYISYMTERKIITKDPNNKGSYILGGKL